MNKVITKYKFILLLQVVVSNILRRLFVLSCPTICLFVPIFYFVLTFPVINHIVKLNS